METTTTQSSMDIDYSDSTNPAENFTNTLNITGYVPYNQRIETYVVPVVFFIIFVVGCIGNGTLVVIFLKHRTMRNVPNT